ncbi:hypothetical protein UY3_05077 [Chelonia mydas]|uniref:Uncharacterized protein n=1 Tax=Chelonia mydas TaxID=8469 RepID=M7C0B7_CHEMY|nr:hypothetical protein UY3_05077 [Chelonia mydas]
MRKLLLEGPPPAKPWEAEKPKPRAGSTGWNASCSEELKLKASCSESNPHYGPAARLLQLHPTDAKKHSVQAALPGLKQPCRVPFEPAQVCGDGSIEGQPPGLALSSAQQGTARMATQGLGPGRSSGFLLVQSGFGAASIPAAASSEVGDARQGLQWRNPRSWSPVHSQRPGFLSELGPRCSALLPPCYTGQQHRPAVGTRGASRRLASSRPDTSNLERTCPVALCVLESEEGSEAEAEPCGDGSFARLP